MRTLDRQDRGLVKGGVHVRIKYNRGLGPQDPLCGGNWQILAQSVTLAGASVLELCSNIADCLIEHCQDEIGIRFGDAHGRSKSNGLSPQTALAE